MAACGSRGAKFYFKNGFRALRDRAYQVTRSEFDELLLNHSRENGAGVREETTVKNIAPGEDRVQLEIETLDSATKVFECRYLLDCSGRQTVVGNFFKLKNLTITCKNFPSFLISKMSIARPASTGRSSAWCADSTVGFG